MIVVLPVGKDSVHAVNADRIVAVERDPTHLRVRVDFGTHERTYVLEDDECGIAMAFSEFLENYDEAHYVLDLTWLKQSPAPEAVATGD